MFVETTGKQKYVRPLLLIILVLLFTGLILCSAIFIRFSAGKSQKTEFNVTELSLTHKIVRDKDGKLKVPSEDPGADKNNGGKPDGDACYS